MSEQRSKEKEMAESGVFASVPATSVAVRRRRLPRWVWMLGGLVLLGLALRLTVFRTRPVSVQVAVVSRGTVEETVTNTRAATVKARLRARLSPETAGRVVALPFREGQRVPAGALLLSLDSGVQRAQVDLAREDVRAASARVDESCLASKLAGSELRRGEELRQGGIASEQALERLRSESERAQAACRAASATLDQARARENVARVDLAHTELRAPFAGVIAEIQTEIGEWITPSPPGVPIPPVIEMLDPSSIYVAAPIDEMDAERVATGQEVRITVDSRRGESFPGRLVRVAPYVQDLLEQNRTVEVEAEFSEPGVAATLLPGTSADVEVILSRREGVLQVPTAALSQEQQVLVLEGGRLAERGVETGLRNWKTTEVRGGLKQGERVVTLRDTPQIRDGARAVAEGGR